MLDTQILISVLTAFVTEGGPKYCCPHLYIKDEAIRPYFPPDSLYPSVWLHTVLLHTIRNKFAFFIRILRPSVNWIYHQAERLKISVIRPHFVGKFTSFTHLLKYTETDCSIVKLYTQRLTAL